MGHLTCPAIVVVLPLEGSPELRLLAHGYEDERALRVWLRSSSVLGELPGAVLALLDALNELDWPAAA
jgi:hypothetical protein